MKNQDTHEGSPVERPPQRPRTEGGALEHVPQEQRHNEILRRSVRHVYGPEVVERGRDELAVLCLVRNGRSYVESFVEHYRSLGAKHLFFLDNGSTDGTVEALRAYENVTVLQTELAFKEYQMLMKQYLFERFGRDRWSLYADIDELFDYPFSEIVTTDSFLRYLTQNRFTAVVAQMLDMFPEGPISAARLQRRETLKERHVFYDLSDIERKNYSGAGIVTGVGNTISNKEIKAFRGGIQQRVFGLRGPLTKHPLVFFDGTVKPMDGSSHNVSHARVADVTCVLLHYRFLDYLYEKTRRAVREENYMKDSFKHKIMAKILDESPDLQVKRPTSRMLHDLNDLVENQFLLVSENYVEWAELEEKRGAGVDRAELRGLADDYFKMKARAQTERVLQLEQEIERWNVPSEQDAARLLERSNQRAERQHERNRRLEQRVQGLEQQLSTVRNEAQSLRQRNLDLSGQLQSVQASRSWKLLTGIGRIRDRVLGRRRG